MVIPKLASMAFQGVQIQKGSSRFYMDKPFHDPCKLQLTPSMILLKAIHLKLDQKSPTQPTICLRYNCYFAYIFLDVNFT